MGGCLHFLYQYAKGEEGILVYIYLPAQAMKRLVKELDDALKNAKLISNLQWIFQQVKCHMYMPFFDVV